jgi:hypothetical protein
MQITREMSKGQIVALSFYDDGLTATATVAMAVDALVLGVSAPWDGCLLAMATNNNAASTHATATETLYFTKNTTATAASVALTYTTVKNTATFARDAYRFVAGDVLGVSYAASAGFGPNTIDGQCTLFVKFDIEGV